MTNRKGQSSEMRQQQGQSAAQFAPSTQPISQQSLPLQQQQANLQTGSSIEPKLVRDPKTGDYYDQNQQSSSAIQQQYAASPIDGQQQGTYKRKQTKTMQHGSAHSKLQTK